MESFDKFFSDVHQKVKGVIYEVQAAVVDRTQPQKQKRKTTTVRQPFLLQAPTDCDTERCSNEEAMTGVWYYADCPDRAVTNSYRIVSIHGKLVFKEGKGRGDLVPSADSDWMLVILKNAAEDVLGTLRLRCEGSKMISQFKNSRVGEWGERIVAAKECDAEGEQPLTSRGVAPRCTKSRAVSDEFADECGAQEAAQEAAQEVKERKYANTAPPQMLHFVAPQDFSPGQPICLLGPHGEPITVPLPEDAEPGKPCCVYLGPKSTFQVVVPDGAIPGTEVLFHADGDLLRTVVPPGKNPGDILEIVPPVVLIQVPRGAKPGEEIMYRTPAGTMASTVVPDGFAPGHYFASLLPLPPAMREKALRNMQGAPSSASACSASVQPPAESSGSVYPPAQAATFLQPPAPEEHEEQWECGVLEEPRSEPVVAAPQQEPQLEPALRVVEEALEKVDKPLVANSQVLAPPVGDAPYADELLALPTAARSSSSSSSLKTGPMVVDADEASANLQATLEEAEPVVE